MWIRDRPYRRWVEQNKISVRSLFDSVSASAEMPDLAVHQRQFGFTQEDVEPVSYTHLDVYKRQGRKYL